MDEPAGLRTPVCLGLLFFLLLGAVLQWHLPIARLAQGLFDEQSVTVSSAVPAIQPRFAGTTLCIVAPQGFQPLQPIQVKRTDCTLISGDVQRLDTAHEARLAAEMDAPQMSGQGTAAECSDGGVCPGDALEVEQQQARAKQLAAGQLMQRLPTSRAPGLARIFEELQRRASGRPDHLTESREERSPGIPAAPPTAARKQNRHAAKPKAGPWPSCPTLTRQLSQLTEPQSKSWAQRVQSTFKDLSEAALPGDAKSTQALQQLESLAEEAQQVAASLQTGQSELLIAAYNVRRRAEIWQAVSLAADPTIEQRASDIAKSVDRREMLARIADIRKALKRIAHGPAWADYLMLDQLATFAASSEVHDLDKRCRMACLALSKRELAVVSQQQLEFLHSPLIVALDHELKRWATSPVNMHDLLQKLELFERRPYTRFVNQVTDVWSALRWSLSPEYNHVASLIDIHYRNANIRVSFTEDFVNRMIPAVQAVRSPVREKILGADVSGQSHSQMRMTFDLMDDADEIRLRMQADGNLAANTQSKAGTVTMYNMNRSAFILEKLFVMGPEGIQTTPAKAAASGRSSLMGLQTLYDPFPIIGSIVRRAAKQRAFETRGLQRRIFEDRVAQRARSQVDKKVRRQLATAEKQLNHRLLTPLGQMDLNPTTISMSSSEERASYRGRLAAHHQLAAFTARPRELPNNVCSIQMHNSAVNNLLRQLELDGQRGELRDIIQNVMNQFDFKAVPIPEEIPEDVYIALAESDAVRIVCDNDRVSIILAIAELSADQHSWHNFFVRAHYTPGRSQAFKCDLTREAPIELRGKHKLCGTDDLALRAIFTKVFAKSRSIPLIHPELTNNPRMKDLRIDQFVARDGWVAISVGGTEASQQANKPQPHSSPRSATQALLDKLRRL